MSTDLLQINCDSCGESTQEPYVECCECSINLCTACFASGREVQTHKNDHKYAIRRNDFPLFDNCNWSAKEECKLLSGLSTYGYGNWEDISKIVQTRSKLECEVHYKKYYIENVQYKELDILPETDQSMFPKPIIPYLYNMDISRDPPRNNQSDPHLAGYNAYRSEFELSYDNNAESIFNIEADYSDDEEDEPCMDALKISLVNALNTRLRERRRCYRIIQTHGLIMTNKLLSWIQRYYKTLTKQKAERLLPFMQFMSGMQFDAFIESISLEAELLQKYLKFCEYRRLGIKSLYGVRVYKKMKGEHEIVVKEQKSATVVMSLKYDAPSPLKGKVFHMNNGTIPKCKRYVNPLEIEDLPGYHQLSDTEKSLCSKLRLVPENYLEIKELLISENNKLGSLRLLDARKIVKKDVNKTRKIYDHLALEGFIKPINSMIQGWRQPSLPVTSIR